MTIKGVWNVEIKINLGANNGHKENRESQNDSFRRTNINSTYNTKPNVKVSAKKQSAKHSNYLYYLYSLVHWLSEFNHNGKMHFPGMKNFLKYYVQICFYGMFLHIV